MMQIVLVSWTARRENRTIKIRQKLSSQILHKPPSKIIKLRTFASVCDTKTKKLCVQILFAWYNKFTFTLNTPTALSHGHKSSVIFTMTKWRNGIEVSTRVNRKKINTHHHDDQRQTVKQNKVQNVEELDIVVFSIHYTNCLCEWPKKRR